MPDHANDMSRVEENAAPRSSAKIPVQAASTLTALYKDNAFRAVGAIGLTIGDDGNLTHVTWSLTERKARRFLKNPFNTQEAVFSVETAEERAKLLAVKMNKALGVSGTVQTLFTDSAAATATVQLALPSGVLAREALSKLEVLTKDGDFAMNAGQITVGQVNAFLATFNGLLLDAEASIKRQAAQVSPKSEAADIPAPLVRKIAATAEALPNTGELPTLEEIQAAANEILPVPAANDVPAEDAKTMVEAAEIARPTTAAGALTNGYAKNGSPIGKPDMPLPGMPLAAAASVLAFQTDLTPTVGEVETDAGAQAQPAPKNATPPIRGDKPVETIPTVRVVQNSNGAKLLNLMSPQGFEQMKKGEAQQAARRAKTSEKTVEPAPIPDNSERQAPQNTAEREASPNAALTAMPFPHATRITSELPALEDVLTTAPIPMPTDGLVLSSPVRATEVTAETSLGNGKPILPAVPFPSDTPPGMLTAPATPLEREEPPRDRMAFQRLGRMVKSGVEVAVADLYSNVKPGETVKEDRLIDTILSTIRLNASTTLRTLDAKDELSAAMLHIIHKSSPEKFAQAGLESDVANAAQNRQLLQDYLRLVVLNNLNICDVKEPLAQKSGEILSAFSVIGAGIQSPPTEEGKLAGERATVMLAKAFDKAAGIACGIARAENRKTESPASAVSRLAQRANGNGAVVQSALRT